MYSDIRMHRVTSFNHLHILFCLSDFYNFCFIFSRRCSFYSFQMLLFIKRKNTKIFQKESKLSKVFPGPHFPVFGMNTDIYSVNIRIQSKYRKIRTRKNSVFARFSRRDSERESLEIHTHNATNETNENKIIRILQTRFHILQFLMFLFNFISCKVYYKFLLMTRINGPLLP